MTEAVRISNQNVGERVLVGKARAMCPSETTSADLQPTILIHGSPQVELLTLLDLHEDLIDVPGVTQPALLTSEFASVLRSELQAPETDRLLRNRDPAFDEQIFHIPNAQGESMVEPHGAAKQLFFCNLTESDLRSDSPVV